MLIGFCLRHAATTSGKLFFGPHIATKLIIHRPAPYDGQVMVSIFQILVSNLKLMRNLRHLSAPVTDHRQPKASTGAPGIRRVARDEHESKKCASGALLPKTAPPVAIRPQIGAKVGGERSYHASRNTVIGRLICHISG